MCCLNLQGPPGDSITGKQMDKFYDSGMMGTYIKLRNSAGAGEFNVCIAIQDLFKSSKQTIL